MTERLGRLGPGAETLAGLELSLIERAGQAHDTRAAEARLAELGGYSQLFEFYRGEYDNAVDTVAAMVPDEPSAGFENILEGQGERISSWRIGGNGTATRVELDLLADGWGRDDRAPLTDRQYHFAHHGGHQLQRIVGMRRVDCQLVRSDVPLRDTVPFVDVFPGDDGLVTEWQFYASKEGTSEGVEPLPVRNFYELAARANVGAQKKLAELIWGKSFVIDNSSTVLIGALIEREPLAFDALVRGEIEDGLVLCLQRSEEAKAFALALELETAAIGEPRPTGHSFRLGGPVSSRFRT
jgi:hypothetical protein